MKTLQETPGAREERLTEPGAPFSHTISLGHCILCRQPGSAQYQKAVTEPVSTFVYTSQSCCTLQVHGLPVYWVWEKD